MHEKILNNKIYEHFFSLFYWVAFESKIVDGL